MYYNHQQKASTAIAVSGADKQHCLTQLKWSRDNCRRLCPIHLRWLATPVGNISTKTIIINLCNGNGEFIS